MHVPKNMSEYKIQSKEAQGVYCNNHNSEGQKWSKLAISFNPIN